MTEAGPSLIPIAGLDLTGRHAPFSYQLEAVEAVRDLEYSALFHEQGLGKTKIGVDLALSWLRTNAVDAVLFVTKKSLVRNWEEEIAEHTHLRPVVLGSDRRANFFALNSEARIFLAHYEVLKGEVRRMSLFLRTRRVAAILDEAQKIKNPDAALTKTLLNLRDGFARRVVMTGTPVANRPYDIWSQIAFLDGGDALGSDFEAFRSGLDLANDLHADDEKRAEFEKRLGEVWGRISGFSVRETKATAGIELPNKIVRNVDVALVGRQAELYDRIRCDMRAEVMKAGTLVEDDSESVLKRLTRLVQVASDPSLVDEAYAEDPAKMDTLARLLEGAVSAGEKSIVWTSFVETASRLAVRFSHHGTALIHGGRTIEQRNDAVAAFKGDPACRVLVATPGAAKEGLTLTVANHAVFFDRSFSLDDYLQAQDRIHRISQERTCYVWNLIAKGTIDEWIDALLAAKRLAAGLVQSDFDAKEYAELANYDFGKIISAILGQKQDEEGQDR